MEQPTSEDEAQVLQLIIAALSSLDPAARARMIRTVATFYDLPAPDASMELSPTYQRVPPPIGAKREPEFGSHPPLTPKEFLLEKSPQTDIERVVCLAYYLAHYRDTTHFRTADISKLNTEAAQRKLANTAYSVNHAAQSGYVVPATKNTKQLSAMGERFIEALPDRNAAKEVRTSMRPRKNRKRAASIKKGD